MKIAVVAPSGPPDPDLLAVGKAAVAARFPSVEFLDAPNLARREGYLAGEDDERMDGLDWAFLRSGADLVWCARGGYGATRIAVNCPWEEYAIATRRMPLVGFSDATALLAAYHARGGTALHGPMLASDIARGASERSWESIGRLLLSPPGARSDAFTFAGRRLSASFGSVRGPILAGNLSVLAALCGTPLLPRTEGRVICLEDVNEEPYRVDRCLTQLREAGFFAGAVAVTFGSFTDCLAEEPAKSFPIDEVLARFASGLDLPAVAGFPFGHAPANSVLPWDGTIDVREDAKGFSVRVAR